MAVLPATLPHPTELAIYWTSWFLRISSIMKTPLAADRAKLIFELHYVPWVFNVTAPIRRITVTTTCVRFNLLSIEPKRVEIFVKQI
jgi:hypothetical protein